MEQPQARSPPALISKKRDGTPYRRRDDVEDAIGRALALLPDQWIDLAERRGQGRLPAEALVFLIRQVQHTDRDLFGRLIWELGTRIARIAKTKAKGFDRDTTDEILIKVSEKITDLVIAPTPSRQSEFLEIAFRKAVERHTLNVVEQRWQAPLPLPASISHSLDEESEDIERPHERVADESPTTAELMEQLHDIDQRRPLLRSAQTFVKDVRHYQALLLHYGFGWPISSIDDSVPTLVTYFKVSDRQIRNWMTAGLAAIRKGFGEQS